MSHGLPQIFFGTRQGINKWRPVRRGTSGLTQVGTQPTHSRCTGCMCVFICPLRAPGNKHDVEVHSASQAATVSPASLQRLKGDLDNVVK